MTTVNPQSVVVSVEIDIHQAIKAISEFSEKYPAERLSHSQADALREAADSIDCRIGDAWRMSQLLAK
jgi:hypothetical protein